MRWQWALLFLTSCVVVDPSAVPARPVEPEPFRLVPAPPPEPVFMPPAPVPLSADEALRRSCSKERWQRDAVSQQQRTNPPPGAPGHNRRFSQIPPRDAGPHVDTDIDRAIRARNEECAPYDRAEDVANAPANVSVVYDGGRE